MPSRALTTTAAVSTAGRGDARSHGDARREIHQLLQKALSLDPNSVTALWLLGNAAFDKGDSASALEYWQRAHPLLADAAHLLLKPLEWAAIAFLRLLLPDADRLCDSILR